MDGVGPVRDMKSVHQDLQITNAMFNALTEDLQIAMEQHNIPSSVRTSWSPNWRPCSATL
jgi:hemoglobin